MSATPRTDKASFHRDGGDYEEDDIVVLASFARGIEVELAYAKRACHIWQQGHSKLVEDRDYWMSRAIASDRYGPHRVQSHLQLMKHPTYREVAEQQLEEIMDEFDFHKVQRVMELLKWTWAGCGDETPSVSQLRKSAREHFRRVIEYCENLPDGYYCGECGGFCPSLEKHTNEDGPWLRLKLAFELVTE